jgi:hypothetical protein
MSNHFCHMVLAPEVSRSQIESFARTLRAEQSRPTALTLCDLSGRSVRKPAYVAAKEAGVRLLEVESQLGHSVLIDAATRIFGKGFLYREKDDEGLAVCHPNALWINNTFKRDDRGWLLELPHEPVPWSREAFYALPGNPPESSVTLGIQARFLRSARPNEVRECPMCGTAYQSKRERGQCPNRDCSFVWAPFKSREEAVAPVPVKLDAFTWTRCPRCQKARSFMHRIEQCHRCGQLLIESGSRFQFELKDNTTEVQDFIDALSPRTTSMSLSRWISRLFK